MNGPSGGLQVQGRWLAFATGGHRPGPERVTSETRGVQPAGRPLAGLWAGAPGLIDMEFVQFLFHKERAIHHGCGAALGCAACPRDRGWSVRGGDGGTLKNNPGEKFMFKIHPPGLLQKAGPPTKPHRGSRARVRRYKKKQTARTPEHLLPGARRGPGANSTRRIKAGAGIGRTGRVLPGEHHTAPPSGRLTIMKRGWPSMYHSSRGVLGGAWTSPNKEPMEGSGADQHLVDGAACPSRRHQRRGR